MHNNADSGGGDTRLVDQPLRAALLESRQRWRDLVTMTADLVFETDASGCFTFISPDPVLGWSAGELLAEPARTLLADPPAIAGADPFRPGRPTRGKRVWMRRADGSLACIALAAAALLDPAGHTIGARGLGIDITDQDEEQALKASALRRTAVTDDILWRMRQEVLAPRMMRVVLDELANALGTEGVAVVTDGPSILHQSGEGAGAVLDRLADLLDRADQANPVQAGDTRDQPILVSACHTRFGEKIALAIWRPQGARDWDPEDRMLATSATTIIRVVLEHQSIQREMARQARTDPLTGLINRRAFLEELPRHIDRLEREHLPGTLVFADLDNFKAVNDVLGHEIGDEILCRTAQLLRDTVRPTDLVARLGGDEFAIWMNGADHLTAAERAEHLRVNGPTVLAKVIGSSSPALGFSIGIATRASGEEVENVMRRADLAMYQVKRDGRGHWRVAQERYQ
jgi:diguanylate cyclase (GGDEF)-like protein